MPRPIRIAQAALVAVLVVFIMGSADTAARYNDLGHKMMCVCGCNELLIECNHVGCPDSAGMLADLRTDVDRGDSDRAIFAAFQEKYGPTALAAPMLTRFNMLAWIMPPLVLLAGILVMVLIVRKWRLRTVDMPPPLGSPVLRAARDRVRKETEL